MFKGSLGRFDFRALYAVTGQEQNDGELTLIYGQPTSLSPAVINDKMIEKFFKYSSS